MDPKAAFGNRFHELCAEAGTTHRALAAELGVNLHDIIRWDTGGNRYLPSVRTLCKLAARFRCSVDYLLGRTDDESVVDRPAVPRVAGRFRALVYGRGYTYALPSREAGIRNTTLFYNWEGGRSLPQAENVCRVADVLGCSADELLGRTGA